MKKLINILLCIILVISMVSCNKTEEKLTKERTTKGMDTSLNNIKVHLGQAFTDEVKGDLNKDGTYLDTGNYFLYNLKVENVKDYEYIVINVKIQNDNDYDVDIFKAGWQATLPNGEQLPDLKIKGIGEQEKISSNSDIEFTILVPVSKKLNINEINLKYDNKNYSNLNSSLVEGTTNKEVSEGIGPVEFNNIIIGD